ncbi:hypothetical protein [Streptomyces sp. NPDC051183]|uniref:hypothetical protein n=1 Tax=unclassified Streptomyces TaxID=2593676 RepID=UPI0034230FFC
MKNIARVFATTALVGFAVLTAGGVAQADGGPGTDWPVAPASATPGPGTDWPIGPKTDWPVAPNTDWP